MPPTRPTAGVAEALALAMGSSSETLLRDPPYFARSSSETPSPGPPQLYYNLDRIRVNAVREIQEDEDRRIVELLNGPAPTYSTGGVEDRSGLTLESLREIFNQIEGQGLRSLAPMLSRQDYEDILALYAPFEQSRILPVTAPDFLESGLLPGDQVQVHGLPGSFTIQEVSGMGVINPRGAELLAARRVQIPEFEIQSSPSISLEAIRTRRFDLIERGVHLEPIVQRILDAVVRAKSAPEPKPFRQSSGSPRSVWEALVDLDLVDVGSS